MKPSFEMSTNIKASVEKDPGNISKEESKVDNGEQKISNLDWREVGNTVQCKLATKGHVAGKDASSLPRVFLKYIFSGLNLE